MLYMRMVLKVRQDKEVIHSLIRHYRKGIVHDSLLLVNIMSGDITLSNPERPDTLLYNQPWLVPIHKNSQEPDFFLLSKLRLFFELCHPK